MIQNEEFVREFVEEALLHMDNVENNLLMFEKGNIDKAVVNEIFRAVHSIKGTAGFFALHNIVELAHAFESLFGDVRSGKTVVTVDMLDVLLEATDILRNMISDVVNSHTINIETIKNKVVSIAENSKSSADDEKSEKKQDVVIDIQVKDDKEAKIEIPDGSKSILQEVVKHGHHLYKVRLNLNEDLMGKGVTPIKFFKKIESIGYILDAYLDIEEIDSIESVFDAEVAYVFLFATVLEEDLVSMALELPMERVYELAFDIIKNDLEKWIEPEHNVSNGIKPNGKLTENGNAKADKKIKTPEIVAIQESKERESEMEHENAEDENEPLQQHLSQSQQLKNHGSNSMANADSEIIKPRAIAAEDSIRVSVNLLNELLNMASEMVLGRNQLLRILETHSKNILGLGGILQNIDHITTELQEKIMQTRMQPVANVFNKFPRIVRELSKKLNKNVEIFMSGTEVELDKSIIESLSDPLTHLVRNALDHGIEKPSVREKKGKTAVGTLHLKAYHEGGYVNIDIIDDGAGIDVERIKQKALDKGIINRADIELMHEHDILDLLFKPGFSTAEVVTDVSGRGVGMDVVKTNIEKLGGTIEIITAVGKGSTFRLNLPLTLAIIPSLIVEVEKQKFALPQVNLQEMVRIKPGDSTRRIEQIHDSKVLRLRGRLLPLVHLSEVLGLEKKYHSSDGIVRVLVLRIAARRFGLIVDVIHDGEEILVKPLPRHIKDMRFYSGVTILGDGKTAMILDPEGIVTHANFKFTDDAAEKVRRDNMSNKSEDDESLSELQNILLFKCSGPETYGIDLAMVARVEEIDANTIECIGDKEYIQFRGNALRLLRLEHYLPVERGMSSARKFYVIIPKMVKYPMGVIIEKIHDTLETHIKFSKDHTNIRGLLGSAILNKHITLLVNIYEIFEMAAPEHYAVEMDNAQIGFNKVLLLVEDTPFFMKVTKTYLEWAGFTVLTATNGQEALHILKDARVDLVVTDIVMPVMDGFELVKAIRADENLYEMPVIALTSMTSDSYQQKALETGFNCYEFKLDKGRLLGKINNVLREKTRMVSL